MIVIKQKSDFQPYTLSIYIENPEEEEQLRRAIARELNASDSVEDFMLTPILDELGGKP